MAEEQKPVDVVAQTAVEETPVVAVEETPAVETTAPAPEDKPAEETKPAETTAETEAPKEEQKEEKKEDVKPIESGFLGHKAQGASFPKNLIASKAFFFFGSDAVEPEALATYKRTEKSAEAAHHNIAWASHSGKGLLFIGDKKFPHGIINLSDATEPETDGSNKFFFTAKGNKHSFKAATTAERDNWVAQLKEKIAEAKEILAVVTESELYKKTVESFKPVAKEEKPVEVKEDAPVTEEAPKTEETAPKEEEVAKEEALKPVEEPKRRSASRKRASFFGFGKKEEKKDEKKEETPAEETPAPEVPAETAAVEPVVETEAPVEETPAVDVAVPETDAETKPVEDAPVESPKEKPAAAKRNSFFGGVFSKKEKKSAELKADVVEPVKDAETTESAPVIPPVDTSDPIAVDVAAPVEAPVEVVEAPVANGEPKKEIKEKRKSSLPFAFGKRDKSPVPVDGEEKTSKSAFSKLRATIKGKSAAKPEEKPAEEAKTEAVADETPAAEEEAPKVEEIAKPVEETEAENKPEGVAATTPAVTAAA